MRLNRRLEASIDAPSDARRLIEGWSHAVPEAIREDLYLVVSELISNSVRHVNPPLDEAGVTLELWTEPGLVRGEVTDGGAGFTPLLKRPGPAQVGGWGLLLVDKITDRWGVRTDADGTTVWFELTLP